MPKTTYLSDVLLNEVLTNVPYTPVPTVYLALYTVSPTGSGGGTEVTGGSYVRQVVAFNTATAGSSANGSPVSFPIAAANWGTVVAFAVLDAIVGGNMLYYGTLSAPRTIMTNDQMVFPTGQLLITEG